MAENGKLKKENQRLSAENMKAHAIMAEAGQKAENAEAALREAKMRNIDFDNRVSSKVTQIQCRMESDMKTQLKEKLQRQTTILGMWTWVIAFISAIQTGYIVFINVDVAATIPEWFLNRGSNAAAVVTLLGGLFRWSYKHLIGYVHSYVAAGVIVLVSIGIAAGVFVILKCAFERIAEKWDDRWQYYKAAGVSELRKAVSIALCVISVTLSVIAATVIPANVNVVSWWIIFSAGLNAGYHACCKGSY
jgi:hypothetical protein